MVHVPLEFESDIAQCLDAGIIFAGRCQLEHIIRHIGVQCEKFDTATVSGLAESREIGQSENAGRKVSGK